MTILHLCPRELWDRAQADGAYAADSLAAVVRVHDFPPNADGTSSLPATLVT